MTSMSRSSLEIKFSEKLSWAENLTSTDCMPLIRQVVMSLDESWEWLLHENQPRVHHRIITPPLAFFSATPTLLMSFFTTSMNLLCGLLPFSSCLTCPSWSLPMLPHFSFTFCCHKSPMLLTFTLPALFSSSPSIAVNGWRQVFELIHLHCFCSLYLHCYACLHRIHTHVFCLASTDFHSSSLQCFSTYVRDLL